MTQELDQHGQPRQLNIKERTKPKMTIKRPKNSEDLLTMKKFLRSAKLYAPEHQQLIDCLEKFIKEYNG